MDSLLPEEELFNKSDQAIQEIIQLLEEELVWFSKRFGNLQKRSDLSRGLMRVGGFLVPRETIEYRILFDGYEFANLENFLTLYKETNENKGNIFTEFSFRTLIEVGFFRTQILYSDKISDEEKNSYKSLLLLADYFSLGIDSPKRAEDYKKLYKDHKKLLFTDEIAILDEMENILEKHDILRHPEFVGKSYRLISKREKTLFNKTTTLPIFREKNIKGIYSSWSRILHGNFLLLKDLFSERRKNRGHKLRSYWFLMMAGVNVINHAATYTKEDTYIAKAKGTTKQYEVIAQLVAKLWESFE